MAYQIRSSQHLPYGGDREGLKMVTGETYFYTRYQPPLDRISPHLASPVGEGQIHLTA